MRTFTVAGSHGQLTVNAETGAVVSTACSVQYDHIKKFDVGRYRKDNAIADNTIPEVVDIITIGYWSHRGEYEAPIDFETLKRYS